MRVAFLDPLEERLLDFPKQFLAKHEVLTTGTAGEFPVGWESADAAIWWDTAMDASIIERMPNLKFMQRVGWFRSHGDASAALAKGIPVAVTPFGVSDRVAQHGFTLMLMLLRKMEIAIDALERRLNPDDLQELPADTGGQNTINWARIDGIQSPNDMTIGIIGFGEIGASFARLLAPFNTRTLAYRRRPLEAAQEAYYNVQWSPLDDLLRESDVVVSFVPGIPEAVGMMGAREFALMKPTAYFVNCGRARSTDEAALLAVLKEGRIAGAGLDVHHIEPLPRQSEFRDLANTIVTPHSAGGVAGWTDTFRRIAMNLDRVEAGRKDVTITLKPGDYQPA